MGVSLEARIAQPADNPALCRASPIFSVHGRVRGQRGERPASTRRIGIPNTVTTVSPKVSQVIRLCWYGNRVLITLACLMFSPDGAGVHMTYLLIMPV